MGRLSKTVEIEPQVIELRRAGMTFADIAATLKVSPEMARNSFRSGLKRIALEAGVEELRNIESDRLDRLQRAAWAKALQGDLPAIHTVLRIMERRARLFGLDAPIQVAATVEHLDPTVIDSEVARLVGMLKQTPIEAKAIEVGGGQIEN